MSGAKKKLGLALLCLLPLACNALPFSLFGTGSNTYTKSMDLPFGANALVILSSSADKASSAAETATADECQAEVTLELAVIVLKKIKLELPEDEGDESGEPEGMEAEGEEHEGDEDGDDDDEEEEKILLHGPFIVDLVNETVVNLGPSHIDDDADDDGESDDVDDDDDGDGVSDDEDDDDDGDGVADGDDHVPSDCEVFDALELPPGTYTRIRCLLHQLEPGHAKNCDTDMVGYSVRVAGKLGETPFEYCSKVNEHFELRSEEGIVVEPGSFTTFMMKFDPAAWFACLDPAALELNDAGVAVICDGQNEEAAHLVKHRIKTLSRLGEYEEHEEEFDDDDDDADDDTTVSG